MPLQRLSNLLVARRFDALHIDWQSLLVIPPTRQITSTRFGSQATVAELVRLAQALSPAERDELRAALAACFRAVRTHSANRVEPGFSTENIEVGSL